jgi:hypothetical protein
VVIRVVFIDVYSASCVLLVVLDVSWITLCKMGKVCVCNTVKCKLEVVRYAQEHGNRAVGITFVVDEMNVR